ncbi:hypothetical protein [Parasphingorhabdus pacifica]
MQLEPVPRLEWSLATEAHPPVLEGAAPSSLRCSWIHRASEEQVLTLFRKLNGAHHKLPAPWWLRALDRGELPSRNAAFEFEDDLHELLTGRPGWFFVPWPIIGETGSWEYGPSDRGPVKTPTTVVLTDRHPGWVNVIPAHSERAPQPHRVGGIDELRSALPHIESW